MDKGRKRTDKPEDSPHIQAAKEEVLPGYEEYLVLLQERNRLLKRLRKKSKKDIDQERREQGFSLYVNGPHKDGKPVVGQQASIPTQPVPKTARKPKTAGERPRNNQVLDNQALQQITLDEIERQREMARAKTAPSARERRRNWKVDSSVEIKTTRGGEKVKAPDILSGKYADDFESGDDSDELRSSASENSVDYTSAMKNRKPAARKAPPPRESDMFNSSDSINSEEDSMEQDSEGEDLVIDASRFSKHSNSSPRKLQKSRSKKDNSDNDDVGGGEKLMLSMRELRTLRQSLVKNAAFRESMARDQNSDDEFVPESPIPEVEEDLSSEEDTPDSPGRKVNLNKPTMKPDDTIVLELGGGHSVPNKKVEKNLSAARRKDIDDIDYRSGSGHTRPVSGRSDREPHMLSNRSQSTKTLGSENVAKKAVRPLSANRRTPDKVWADTDYEASAVMAALKAENEQASKLKQTPKPRSSTQMKAARESQGRLQYDKSEMRPKPQHAKAAESPRSSVSVSQSEPLVPLDKINQIMEKVLKMSPRHQRRLVNMLGKIEKSIVTESQENVPVPSKSKPRSSNNGPMKAVHRSINKKSVSSSSDDLIELHIEIKSNWGHAMKLGLTEIQLYNQSNNLIPISAADVSIHGAEETSGTVDLLFNGKFKTNKDRNMWSCRYHARRPVEIIINVRNPKPGEKFCLSQMKIWNYNKSIADLDIGIKDVKVFVGTDLVFSGPVEKGCGNQVFDYGHVIPLTPQVAHSTECNPQVQVERSTTPEEQVAKQVVVPANSTEKINRKKVLEDKKNRNNMSKSKSRDSLDVSVDKSQRRPPVSPRGERSPSPAPKFPVNKSPRAPREVVSTNHRSISPRPSQEHKKTLRSISMSSQSSSGGDSAPNSRPTSAVKTPQIRSETRTVNHPVMGKNVPYNSQGSDSLSENEDGPSKGNIPAKQRGVKTPRKSKRMAARLDGHSSTEVESSRSVSESMEKRTPPPLPARKSEEKVNRKAAVQKGMEDKSSKSSGNVSTKASGKAGKEKAIDQQKVVADLVKKQESEGDLEDTLKAGGSSVSVASSQDDTPMLQKLKDMNKKDHSNPRKKDMPKWLKQEDITTPFENPPESRDGQRPEPTKPVEQKPPSMHKPPPIQKPPPTQEEINMLIDEELSLFPEQKKSAPEPELAMEVTEGDGTPMQRIQKNRSKWRENPSMNLEESWGSLSQFNKCQRGRISLDMDDDVMDEYINKAAKLAGLTEPAIPEEETMTESTSNMNVEFDDEGFVIPELPHGQELIINIGSTWGDKHYVGLTSIEVFASTGEQIMISKISADPSDINILPEYDKDPRVVKNLIDGHTRTRDDIHMWLAPFMSGKDHLVCCTFEKPCNVAMIRIWNYNKSRIHSYRGAKDVIMCLDSAVIFKGEIARACGGVEGGTEAFGDTILFTMDGGILEAVSQNDEAYEGEMLSDDEPFDVERPSTADEGKERPFTRAVGNINKLERELTVEYEGNMMVYKGQCIVLNFTGTWGDHHYLGLTGLEIVGKEGESIPVDLSMITANPPDVRSLPGHEHDDRTLDKVIDGNNVTMADEHMWLIPFVDGNNHTLTIQFAQKVLMAGLRIWNYNKSKEDTYRGARTLHVAIDEKVVSPPEGFLVRKGPGTCHFDYAQEISFSPQSWNSGGGLSALGVSPSTDESQNYEVVQMPCGFIYQLQLFSTWGDTYYVGLNGIELYDSSLQKIQLTESNISAYPDSVNVLENIQNDARTPDKLIDGKNDTMDGGHMWLAPILPNILNRVYVIFDQPTSISMIKIWNYSKTANRGAKDFALLVDDLLVYNGVLEAIPQTARGILPNCEGPQPYHTILFTNNKDILRKEKNTVLNNQRGEQDVQMTNDKKIVSHYNDPKKAQSGKPVDQNLRPTTGVVHTKKRR